MGVIDYRQTFQEGLGDAAQCIGCFMSYRPGEDRKKREVWSFLVTDQIGNVTTLEFPALPRPEMAREAAQAHLKANPPAARVLPPIIEYVAMGVMGQSFVPKVDADALAITEAPKS